MLINLIGFAAMALDKRRAIRHKWRIPERTLFLIALLFGSIGVLTGMSQGHVAIVMPIVAAMQTGSLNLAGVAMAFGIAGQMLTPTHMCLVITVDYFKANFFKTLKPVLLCEIIILTLFTAYTYFTW